MKNVVLATVAALTFAFSSFAMASDDIEVTANKNTINQTQGGYYNLQEAKIATVGDDLNLNQVGDITITANHNKINQTQYGHHNEQTAAIATVGCDC
jgi:uncharacterized protein YdeI (BOF family)